MTINQDSQRGAGDPAAWKVDLRALSDTELAGVVTGMCSAYGTVVKVAIHGGQSHQNVLPFALVDMSRVSEAERLAAAFNRPSMGTAVVLLLEPRPAG